MVNIADGANAARLAQVDTSGALRTVQSNIPMPARPVNIATYVAAGSATTLISANTAVVGIHRIGVDNYMHQINGVTVRVTLYQQGGADGVCNGSVVSIGTYQAETGETTLDALPSPWMLKPMSGYPQWCLKAIAEIQNGQTSYYLPFVFVNASAVAGVVPPTDAAQPLSPNGTPPQSTES